MFNILFVDSGNTSRSPMAEAILDDALDRSRLDGKVKTDSAGTFAPEGITPPEEAVEVMDEMGLDIEKNKSRQLDEELAEWADLILTMEAKNVEEIMAMFPEYEDKVHTLIGFINDVYGFPGDDGFDVMDIYKEPKEDYIECAKQLKSSIDALILKLEGMIAEDD